MNLPATTIDFMNFMASFSPSLFSYYRLQAHERKKPRHQHIADKSGFNPAAKATSLNPFIPPGNVLCSA
jgi:hypothetical protein